MADRQHKTDQTGLKLLTRLKKMGVISAWDQREENAESVDEIVQLLLQRTAITDFQAARIREGKERRLRVGSYVILDQLGFGGMGRVFHVRHVQMKREAALKMLHTRLMKDQHAVDRFYREVEAAARLAHPNIIAAYDAGSSKGMHFLAMEYAEGRDLASLVKQDGPLAIPLALDYAQQTAEGLAYAHDQGVTHRDLKPANLLLTTAGQVKILDMGLARIDHTSVSHQQQLTGDSALLGTIDFMSPEQGVDPSAADARSDIYSLGCTLYWLITGQPPFPRMSPAAALIAHQRDLVPSLAEIWPSAPAEVDRIIGRAMAKEPGNRFATAREFQNAVQEAMSQLQGTKGNATASLQARTRPATLVETQQIARDLTTNSNASTGEGGLQVWNPRKRVILGVSLAAAMILVVVLVQHFVERPAEPPGQSAAHSESNDTQSADGRSSSQGSTPSPPVPPASLQMRDELLSARVEQLAGIYGKLAETDHEVSLRSLLTTITNDLTNARSDRLRAAVGLVVLGEPADVPLILDALQQPDSSDIKWMITALKPYQTELTDRLWQAISDAGVSASESLGLYRALASWDPLAAEWTVHSPKVAQRIIEAGLELTELVEFEPLIDDQLLPHWKTWAQDPTEDARSLGALKLALARTGSLELMWEVLPHAGRERKAVLRGRLMQLVADPQQRATVVQNLKSFCGPQTPLDVRRRAFSMLWQIDQRNECLELIHGSQDDEFQQMLIKNTQQEFAIADVIETLVALQDDESSVDLLLRTIGVRQFLQAEAEPLGPSEHARVVKIAERWFPAAETASTHAVAGWILRRLEQRDRLTQMISELRREHRTADRSNRQWYVDECGLSMTIVEMVRSDPESKQETQYRLAVSMTEVPTDVFALYELGTSTSIDSQAVVTSDTVYGLPRTDVDWVDAIGFCSWLNESIPKATGDNEQSRSAPFAMSRYVIIQNARTGFEKQLTEFEEADDSGATAGFVGRGKLNRTTDAILHLLNAYKSGGARRRIPRLNINQPYTEAAGYRLPTISEWQQLRAFRDQQTDVNHHEWTSDNAAQSVQVVGDLLPAKHGLFDLSGNVAEWGFSGDSKSIVMFDSNQPVTGWSVEDSSVSHRGAGVRIEPVLAAPPNVGFRIVRLVD